MRRWLTISLATLCAAVTTATACLWDSDTLRQEAAGAPGILEVLVGRYDRFPPAYYERRIEIAEEYLASNRSVLNSYDNAGVACDRLGRHDEAIEWMARKRVALDANASVTGVPHAEHEYRYLANLGTFYTHRWLAGGADRDDLTDLEAAELLIADAIDLNPDAHFGREKYQLLAIRWLLEAPEPRDEHELPLIFDATQNPSALEFGRPRPNGEYADAVEGLSGLIRLGAAWESVDIHYALQRALHPTGRSSITQVANLRLRELLSEGKTSLSTGWIDYEPLDERYPWDGIWQGRTEYSSSIEGMPDGRDENEEWYNKAREEAGRWRDARNQYVLTRLNNGMHPDTHPDFWSGWSEPHAMPDPPSGVLGLQGTPLVIALCILAPILLYIVSKIRRLRSLQIKPAAHPS